MPPLSTNVIEDDDTSSAIFELDSDRFTHSGGDDAWSESPQVHGEQSYGTTSTNIERTECLKSWLLSNTTPGGRLMATNVV